MSEEASRAFMTKGIKKRKDRLTIAKILMMITGREPIIIIK